MKVKVNKTSSKPGHLPMDDSGFWSSFVVALPPCFPIWPMLSLVSLYWGGKRMNIGVV